MPQWHKIHDTFAPPDHPQGATLIGKNLLPLSFKSSCHFWNISTTRGNILSAKVVSLYKMLAKTFRCIALHYCIYPKYSDTSTPYHICSKIWTSTIHYPMLCLKIAGWVANSVDPDETPRSAASHLGLYCLLRPVCPNTYGKNGSQANYKKISANTKMKDFFMKPNPWSNQMLVKVTVNKTWICLCWGFTAQSTQWGHVERGQFT